jgi:hypothetical protein
VKIKKETKLKLLLLGQLVIVVECKDRVDKQLQIVQNEQQPFSVAEVATWIPVIHTYN